MALLLQPNLPLLLLPPPPALPMLSLLLLSLLLKYQLLYTFLFYVVCEYSLLNHATLHSPLMNKLAHVTLSLFVLKCPLFSLSEPKLSNMALSLNLFEVVLLPLARVLVVNTQRNNLQKTLLQVSTTEMAPSKTIWSLPCAS